MSDILWVEFPKDEFERDYVKPIEYYEKLIDLLTEKEQENEIIMESLRKENRKLKNKIKRLNKQRSRSNKIYNKSQVEPVKTEQRDVTTEQQDVTTKETVKPDEIEIECIYSEDDDSKLNSYLSK